MKRTSRQVTQPGPEPLESCFSGVQSLSSLRLSCRGGVRGGGGGGEIWNGSHFLVCKKEVSVFISRG